MKIAIIDKAPNKNRYSEYFKFEFENFKFEKKSLSSKKKVWNISSLKKKLSFKKF